MDVPRGSTSIFEQLLRKNTTTPTVSATNLDKGRPGVLLEKLAEDGSVHGSVTVALQCSG